MLQFGQYAPPSVTILHLSDTHLLQGNRPLGTVDTERNLALMLDRIELLGTTIDAIVFTGDLTDLGEHDAYVRLRELVEPVAARMQAELVWVAGNHDEREVMRSSLLDEPVSNEPIVRVVDVRGLRLIALDTTVPGWHHGELGAAQLDWLRKQLATPAEHGTVLALHHPPLPSHLPLFDILELRDQPALADAIQGSDVRAILGGHLHYASHGMFAGVPVSVAAASCYTMDVARQAQWVNGMDAAQSFHLVHVWEHTLTHTTVPVQSAEVTVTFTPDWYASMAELTAEERLERFSRKQ